MVIDGNSTTKTSAERKAALKGEGYNVMKSIKNFENDLAEAWG
jgi:hypothetical protein